MKSLQRVIVWNPVIFSVIIFLLLSFVISYLIEKKDAQLSLASLEYIRDQKYKTLNKDNLQSAFDFTSLNYTTYIIDEKGKALYDIPYKVAPEVAKLCSGLNSSGSAILKVANLEKTFSFKKNGNMCFVVEGNTNNSMLLGQFTQNIFYAQIFVLFVLMIFLLKWAQRKISKSVKLVTENSENALISKWEAIQIGRSKVDELQNLEKYSAYVIEVLKQGRNTSGSQKVIEIKEIETQYISTKAKYDVEKFKLGLDASPNFICIVDQHGFILYTNREVTDNLGFDFREAENKKITDLWHKEDSNDNWKNKYDESVKTKKSIQFQSFGMKKTGVKYEGEIVITPIQNPKGEVDNFLVIERDITEEKQKERIKSEFISVVSHELRTPMSVIRGYSSLLLDGTLGVLNEKQKEYIDRINSETGRLLELANDMLDIQKFESGKIELKFSKQNVFESIEKIVKTYIEPFKKKGLTLSLENNINDNNLSYALIDPKYFERVIGNLLSNAMKYTEKGEAKVFLLNPDEDHIVIAVKDTGYGIKEAAIPHLFERFYQADGVLARKQEGSGLGLSIIKTVTEAHRGMCWVESKLGVGSTFYVALPVEK